MTNGPRSMEWRRFLPMALVLVCTAAVHLPALMGGQYFLDIYLTEVHPSWVALEQSLANGQLPFWTSDILLGYPLASNPQVGALYPMNWLFVGLLGAARGIVFSVWFHSMWGAMGMYLLARRGGLNAIGATLSSLIVVCSPFFLFYHQAIHGLIALSWFPWALWSAWSFAETRSWRMWVVGCLILAMQMYAGHLQFVAYTVIAMYVVIGWGPTYARRRHRLVALWMGLLQQVVALLLYGPQLLMSYVLWRNSLRSGLEAADMTSNVAIETFGLDDLVEVVSPQFWGGPTHADFWYPEFLGFAVVALILVSLVRSQHASTPPIVRIARILFLGAIGYLILMRIPGVNYVLASIPGLSAFRAPGRLFCWVLIAGALLAGHGALCLADIGKTAPGGARRIRGMLWITLFCGLCFGILLVAGLLSSGTDEVTTTLRREDGWHLIVTAGLLGLGLGLCCYRSQWSHYLPVLAAGVAVVSIVWVGHRYIPTLDADTVHSPPLAPVLRHADSQVRRIVALSVTDANYESTVPGIGWPHGGQGRPERAAWGLQANVGMAHRIQNLHGQTSLPLRRFVRRIFGDSVRALDYPFHKPPPLDSHLLTHLGVTHVLTPSGRKTSELPIPSLSGLEPTRESEGYLVYRLADQRAPARFYPLTAVYGVKGEAESMAMIQRQGKSPDAPLLVEGIQAHGAGGVPLPVSIVAEGNGTATLTVDAPSDGVILYTEAWFPGWTARVNDEDVDVLVADGMFLGIPVQAGKNTVQLAYDPVGLLLGLFLLGLGLLGCVVALTRGRKTSAPGTDPPANEPSPAS